MAAEYGYIIILIQNIKLLLDQRLNIQELHQGTQMIKYFSTLSALKSLSLSLPDQLIHDCRRLHWSRSFQINLCFFTFDIININQRFQTFTAPFLSRWEFAKIILFLNINKTMASEGHYHHRLWSTFNETERKRISPLLKCFKDCLWQKITTWLIR